MATRHGVRMIGNQGPATKAQARGEEDEEGPIAHPIPAKKY